jgi:DHA1 family tetracycline resistance protein-like MFS transporter
VIGALSLNKILECPVVIDWTRFALMSKYQNHALLFIFLTVLVDVIGIGIIIPVIPELLTSLTGMDLNEAAGIGGLLMSTAALMQFFFAPVMGELSDRYGRRPILLLALFGLGMDYLLHAYAPTIAWLFLGRILAGIFGSSYTVATAYIADVSTPEKKAKNFGLVGAAFGLGFIIGPVIGGVFAQWGVHVPFLIAAGLTFLNFLFGFFILPESLKAEDRRPINLRKLIPGVSLINLGSYKAFGGLLLAFFLAQLAGQTLPAIWSFFTIEMYSWSAAEVGYSLAAVGILVAIVQGLLVGKAVSRFGNKRVIMGGFILWSVGMLLYALSFQSWILYASLIPYCVGGVATPTLQGLISNNTPANEQGNLQGTLTSMSSVTFIVGPFISTSIFAAFADSTKGIYFPGAPFVMGAIFLVAGTIVAYYALKKIETT